MTSVPECYLLLLVLESLGRRDAWLTLDFSSLTVCSCCSLNKPSKGARESVFALWLSMKHENRKLQNFSLCWSLPTASLPWPHKSWKSNPPFAAYSERTLSL